MRLALALLMASLVPAQAALTVCNKTVRPLKVAVGRFDGSGWTSRGWWKVAPRGCTAVVPTALVARYYYLFASDGGSGSWDGSRGFCVSRGDKFEIKGRADCVARGFERREFLEVDTGSMADYTQSLAD
jgi:uncharacterized membrane protein